MQDLVFDLKRTKEVKKFSIQTCPEPPSYPRNRQDIFRLLINLGLYTAEPLSMSGEGRNFMCISLYNALSHNLISEREYELCLRSIRSYMNYLKQNYEKITKKSWPLHAPKVMYLPSVLNICHFDNSTEQRLLLYYNWSNKPYPKVTQKLRKKGTKLISLKSNRYEYL